MPAKLPAPEREKREKGSRELQEKKKKEDHLGGGGRERTSLPILIGEGGESLEALEVKRGGEDVCRLFVLKRKGPRGKKKRRQTAPAFRRGEERGKRESLYSSFNFFT